MSLDRDYHPIQPDEPKLTENEIEREVEERLYYLFDNGDPRATSYLFSYVCANPHDVVGALMGAADGDCESAERMVSRCRTIFIEYAKNAPEWDHIRREVEES